MSKADCSIVYELLSSVGASPPNTTSCCQLVPLVQCNAAGTRVSSLKLNGVKSIGTLPSSLPQLSELKKLSIDERVSGFLPPLGDTRAFEEAGLPGGGGGSEQHPSTL